MFFNGSTNILRKPNIQMRKNLFITALLVVFNVCQLAAQQPYKHGLLSQPRGNFIKKDQSTLNLGNPVENNSTGTSGTGSNLDVVFMRVNWTIDPRTATNIISGTVLIRFKTISANVSSITFDLNSGSFNNASTVVTYHGSTIAGRTVASNILTIPLPAAIVASGTLDSVTVAYSGVPPGVSGAAQGYQKGTGTLGASPNQYTGSLSESYEDRDWWPCKADMQDKIDSMDINVTVPWVTPADTFWVATNGVLYDSTITGSSRTFKYKTRYPIASYLVAVSVAKFNRYYSAVNINGTIVPVQFYMLRNGTGQAAKVANMTLVNAAVDSLSRRWGDYPFKLEKHGFYDGLNGAGGMEHQTFSAIANGQFTIPTLVHELGHQWFGDNVSFATWNDLWLAEGPARFSEAYAAEQVPGLGYSAASVQTMKASLKSGALESALTGVDTVSAWIPNSSMSTSNLVWNTPYGASVYEKGGMVITMLRALCGETKFRQAMTNYQVALAGKSATTDSLKNHFNAVLKADISGFFNSYVGGSGGTPAPGFGGVGHNIDTIYWSTPATNKLVLQVGVQTKSVAKNTNYFQGPVVVRATASGKDTTIIFYDWGGGNLSYAGNGISVPFTGGAINYELSFTPTALIYDDSARTMSTGGTRNVTALKGYVWQGATSSAWNTTTNWMAGVVPPSGAQVTIATTVNSPVLPGNTTVGKLFLNAGTKLIIGANTLTINDAITGSGTISGSASSNITLANSANAGTINMDQTSAATRSINNLTLGLGASAKLGNAMDIYGAITLSSATLDLNGTNLTLKSTATATARIADLTNCNLTGATNVTVERYISDLGRRAWRLLAAPVNGPQTIKQAWQENGVNTANLGTNITSPLYTASNGFDAVSNSSSILTHVQGGVSGPSWNATLPNTATTLLSAYPAYMLFVRGDKNATTSNSLHAATVLRATGTIKQGAQAAVTVSSTGTGYTLVGNPYPSPIDFEMIAATTNLNQSYYLWDASLAGTNGIGGYRFVQRTAPNTYQQTPVVLGGPVSDPTIRYIHSGQGFFLKATGANANVMFTEAAKASGVSIVNPIVADATDQQLIANLMVVDANGASLADGIRMRFDNSYLAAIDDDAIKIGNFGANLASYRESKSLIVEKRPLIHDYDTVFLRMTNTGIKNYRFQIGTIDFAQPALKAWLKDAYLGTATEIDLTGAVNDIDFSVTTEPGSAAADRFMIVFAAKSVVPMTFTGIKAYQTAGANTQSNSIAVEWNVANQINIQKYEVERSSDGNNFGSLVTLLATGVNGSNVDYNWTDNDPMIGDNYFRIRAVSNSGEIKYSNIVNVKIEKLRPVITVYPNPVINHSIGLQLAGLEKGNYQLQLINTMGQVVSTYALLHSGTNAVQNIKVSKNISRGYYSLEIVKPDGSKTVKAVYISE
jgi:Peptidase family M1 domain